MCTLVGLNENLRKYQKITLRVIRLLINYKLCTSLYDMRMIDIKLSRLQDVVDNSGKNTPTLRKLKVLLGLMFENVFIRIWIYKNY